MDMILLCRCENLKLPTMGDDGYIKEADGELKGQLQAQEHRSVMQLMPLVVLAAAQDAFDDESTGLPLVELVMRYCPSQHISYPQIHHGLFLQAQMGLPYFSFQPARV